MEKLKALIRHLVLVVLLSSEGPTRCRAFVLGLLQEISQETEV